MNSTNLIWQEQLKIFNKSSFEVSPRGMKIKERLAEQYVVPMISYLSLKDRNVNYPFMFAEAAWICSGSNQYSELEPYMKRYKDFSDDGIFLAGAYGPKIIDQLTYVVDTLRQDQDSRQAVINIWRERPRLSKDIPCTLSFQFFIRKGMLYSVVAMRSQDIVLGFTYDVFTFSMVAKAVQLLLSEQGIKVELAQLCVNVGSLHLYEDHYKDAERFIGNKDYDVEIEKTIESFDSLTTYNELIMHLKQLAERFKR